MYMQSNPNSTVKVYPNHEAFINLKSLASKADTKPEKQDSVKGLLGGDNAFILLLLLIICTN